MGWHRRLFCGGALLALVTLWSCGAFDWGGPEAELGRLLRRDAALLRREQADRWWQRPTLAWQQRRLDAAYRRYLDQHPDHARALVAYGCFLTDHYQEEAGVAQWQRALAVDPRLALAWK